jgi:hypothetical protein
VLAPVLLVASAVLLVLAPFLLIVGVFSAGSSDSGLGFALVVGLVFFVLAGGLWVGSVVCSILGLARARGGYRWSAGVTLALAVGTIPLLSVLDTISDLT